jgi:hypothetical protein
VETGPEAIVWTSRSIPSALTIERERTSRIPSVTSSTFGLASAGYHASVGRMLAAQCVRPHGELGGRKAREAGLTMTIRWWVK